MVSYTTFIKAEELNSLISNIEKSIISIIDCRYSLTDFNLGKTLYDKDHIPYSNYVHLDNELSGKVTPTTGRHPLPDLLNFYNLLREKGISKEKQIIIYDNLAGAFSARFWFMLKQLGFTNVAVLEGGYDRWLELGLPTTNRIDKTEQLSNNYFDNFPKTWNEGPYRIFSKEEIKNIINNKDKKLIDSRSPERWMGKTEPYDKIAGRIPGARNIYWSSYLKDDKTLDKNKLSIFDKVQKNNIYYCGSGVSACFNLLTIAYLELENPGLYPGSFSEWSKNYPNLIESDT